MAFREKSAWISLVSNLAVYAYYFWHVVEARDAVDLAALPGLFVGCLIVLVVLQIVLSIAAAAFSAKAAQAPADERERLFATRATAMAYYVVSAGAVVAAGASMLGLGSLVVANTLLGALVAGELAKACGQVVWFRRGG